MSLFLLGGCSAQQPKEARVQACEPIIEVQKEYVPLPQDLTALNQNPAVPNSGDNAALLDWAMACATNNRNYEAQMRAIRDLQR